MDANAELQARIAALEGRINTRKEAVTQLNATASPKLQGSFNYSVPRRGTPYGAPYRQQPGAGRGYPTFQNQSLVMSGGRNSQNTAAAHSNPTINAKDWVLTRGRHQQLINTAVYEQKSQEKLKGVQETIRRKQIEHGIRQKKQVMRYRQQNSLSTGKDHVPRDEIVVDNIRFRVADGGSRLIRIDGQYTTCAAKQSGSENNTGNPKSARGTPKQTQIGGVPFLRSKTGNLYRSGLVKTKKYGLWQVTTPVVVHLGLNYRRDKPLTKRKDLCPRFTATGYCPHGPQCRFTHDADKVAICKTFLSTGACQAGESCDLSHNPTSHRVPACVHFLRGMCTKDDCRYAHVRVNAGAPVCYAFATLGYCEKGASCAERHVHECPNYSNKGTCRNSKCPLPHVDRAGQLRKAATALRVGEDDDDVMSDLSSNNEYDEIDSDDVDSDDLEEDVDLFAAEVNMDHEFSQQHDFIKL
ncbi:MAG: hypothetical protein M1820_003435 [Bogoriella megaspora]|nr:MAG: hypothetical protein M1820_003435 [Bogoriella megaspora]